MDSTRLQDQVYRGLGISARLTGVNGDAYRPTSPCDPLGPENRYLRLPVLFEPASSTADPYQSVIWHGVFDGSYTQPGDYIVVDSKTYFIASQEPLQPIVCVRTNRIITISRPNQQTLVGGNAYGGYLQGTSRGLVRQYPASVLTEGKTASSSAGLPTDQAVPFWSILMPAPAGVILSPGDFVTDDLNRTAVIGASELTALGWRISAKVATT